MRYRLSAVTFGLVLIASACGDDDGVGTASTTSPLPTTTATTQPSTGEPTTTSSTTTTTLPATTTTTPVATTEPADDAELWIGTATMESTSIESGVDYSGKLSDVRTGEHPAYTRLVFDFTDDGVAPAFLVMDRDGPFLDIPGDVVPVAGNAFVYVNLFPARTVDFDSPDLAPTYEGPLRFTPSSPNVAEVVFISDFEATMEWVIGLDRGAPFRVFTLDDPPRVVVDVADGPGVFFLNLPNFEIGAEPYEAAVLRTVRSPQDALDALFAGPNDVEAEAGLTLVTSEATGAEVVSLEGGVAVVRLVGGCNSGGSTFSVADLILPTLRQFHEVEVVKILSPDGETADLEGPEDSTPACLEP